MSGLEFLSNNNVQAHAGYGLRKEGNKVNFAIYGGLSYYTGVLAVLDSSLGYIPKYYDGIGVYFSAQAISKFSYDIGFGAEAFGELGQNQRILGIKFVLFFSGAYRGLKKNYNPYVRTENRK